MKKPNILLGLFGGILAMAIAPGLCVGKMYVAGAICFIVGLGIIDYNRNGN